MGLKKAYDELTDNPEFSDGLTIATGESIKDDYGNYRLRIESDRTQLRDNEGNTIIRGKSGGTTRLFSWGESIVIRDEFGSFNAIQYIPDSTIGTLELRNADLHVIDSFTGIGGNQNTTYQKQFAISIKSDRTATYDSQRIEFNDNSTNLPHIFASNGELKGVDSAGNKTTLT